MFNVRCTIMRGGTSRALFFLEKDLPGDLLSRKELISRALGSPDPYGKQIDGLGGATPSTSKVAIVGKRLNERNAVNYTFCQVDIASKEIDLKGNCGNISSAVGSFAIEAGLIDDITEPISIVKIYNTNTSKYIVAHVPVKNGEPLYEGGYVIAGIQNGGSKIQLDFLEPSGAMTGKLLPTGKVKEKIQTNSSESFEVTIVDAANPVVFLDAAAVGLNGIESPSELDSSTALLKTLEEIRSVVACKIGLTEKKEDITMANPVYPFICLVTAPKDYVTSSGKPVRKEETDITARLVAIGKSHLSFAITGGICLAAASKIKGSIVYDKIPVDKKEKQEIKIGHPSGVMDVGAEVECDGIEWTVTRGSVYRTARKLMSGEVYV